MATWKRLTQNLSTPVKIDVNMDAVATMERNEDYTIVTFVFARGDHQYALNSKKRRRKYTHSRLCRRDDGSPARLAMKLGGQLPAAPSCFGC